MGNNRFIGDLYIKINTPTFWHSLQEIIFNMFDMLGQAERGEHLSRNYFTCAAVSSSSRVTDSPSIHLEQAYTFSTKIK